MAHEHDSLDTTNNPDMMPPPATRQTDADADIRQAKHDLHTYFGSVTPHARPEDFTALRREFEERAAEDARTRGQQ